MCNFSAWRSCTAVPVFISDDRGRFQRRKKEKKTQNAKGVISLFRSIGWELRTGPQKSTWARLLEMAQPPLLSTGQIGGSRAFQTRGDSAETTERQGREASPPLRPPAAADADDDDSTRRPPSTRLRLQEHVWSPSMEMAGCSLSKVQMEVDDKSPKEHDTIKIFLEEEMETEVEAFSGFIIGSYLRGKMTVSFPPNSDRFVQFELGKLFDLKLESHPFIDKDLLRNMWYVKPKSPERPFRTGPDEILRWNQSVFIAPPPPLPC